MAQFGALNVAGLLVKCFVEFFVINLFLPVTVVIEKLTHHAFRVDMAFAESIICLACFFRHALFEQRSVVMVHVIHVVIAGIMGDVELRVHANQLLQSVFHAQNTADNHGTFSVYMRLSLENLGEITHHSFGNLTVLLCTKLCQFTVTTLCCIAEQAQFMEHLLSFGCEFS